MRPRPALVGSLALSLSLPLLAQTTPPSATTAPAPPPVSAPSTATAPIPTNSPAKLTGAFGLRFGTPVKELVPFLPVAQRQPDPSSSIRPPRPDTRFARDSYQIGITRETGLLWSIEASTVPLPSDDNLKLEVRAEEMAANLSVQYGEPFREYRLGQTLPHLIWRTDTSTIVLKPSFDTIYLSYVDDRLAEQARQETLAALKAGLPKKGRFGRIVKASPSANAASPLTGPSTTSTATATTNVTTTATPVTATNPRPPIDGAFGVRFGSAFKTLRLGGMPAKDDPNPWMIFEPPQPSPLFAPGSYSVSWAFQSGLVWGLEAYVGPFADPAAREARITQITAALTAQYGPPFRDHSAHVPASHLVWRVGSNAVILDAMAAVAEEILVDDTKPSRYLTISYQDGALAGQAHREAIPARRAEMDARPNLPEAVPLKWPKAPK